MQLTTILIAIMKQYFKNLHGSMLKLIVLIMMSSQLIICHAQEKDYAAQYQEAYLAGDFPKALKAAIDWHEHARAIETALLVADIYAGGMGNTPDYENAIKYYKLAAFPTDIYNEAGKYMAAYANRMWGVLSLIGVDENHVFTRKDLEPFYRAIEIGNDAYSMYFIGHSVLSGDYLEGDEDEALEFLQKAADNNCIPALVDLGGVYENYYDDEDTALDLYIKAANIDLYTPSTNDVMEIFVNPNNVLDPNIIYYWNSACNNAGTILYRNENYDEALRWYKKINLPEAKYYRNRALCMVFLGEVDNAINEYEESLKLEEDAKVHHMLGMLYFEMKNNPEKAKNHLTRAIEMGNQAAGESYKEYFN